MDGNKSETFDPWAPQNDIKPLAMPFMKDPRRDMQSSESYIASLEAKLTRIKKKTCNSKDMLKSLSVARQEQMEHIEPASDYSFSEEGNTSSRLAQLQRRIVPQQALTADELQVLVENDELAKLMESISLEMEMEKEQFGSALELKQTGTGETVPGKMEQFSSTTELKQTGMDKTVPEKMEQFSSTTESKQIDTDNTVPGERTLKPDDAQTAAVTDTSESSTVMSTKEALQEQAEEKDICVKNDNETE